MYYIIDTMVDKVDFESMGKGWRFHGTKCCICGKPIKKGEKFFASRRNKPKIVEYVDTFENKRCFDEHIFKTIIHLSHIKEEDLEKLYSDKVAKAI